MIVTKWEYKRVFAPDTFTMNECGNDGWELIIYENSGHLIFKRPLVISDNVLNMIQTPFDCSQEKLDMFWKNQSKENKKGK